MSDGMALKELVSTLARYPRAMRVLLGASVGNVKLTLCLRFYLFDQEIEICEDSSAEDLLNLFCLVYGKAFYHTLKECGQADLETRLQYLENQ